MAVKPLVVMDGNGTILTIATVDDDGNLLIHGDRAEEWVRNSAGSHTIDTVNRANVSTDANGVRKSAPIILYFEADGIDTMIPAWRTRRSIDYSLLGIAGSEVT